MAGQGQGRDDEFHCVHIVPFSRGYLLDTSQDADWPVESVSRRVASGLETIFHEQDSPLAVYLDILHTFRAHGLPLKVIDQELWMRYAAGA
jgi:hypothetical protein